ncbi:hypothetical protein GCM10010510_26200 [Streptomyces anandii JCM 4720]|nr:hypothetical protein GCM10010510_26200 [Streptomyces anandii JCM 4720]
MTESLHGAVSGGAVSEGMAVAFGLMARESMPLRWRVTGRGEPSRDGVLLSVYAHANPVAIDLGRKSQIMR